MARASYGRLLAVLAAPTGDIPAAEDALSDAFEQALKSWPQTGIPDNPKGWLVTVARNRLRDLWKSAAPRRQVPLGVLGMDSARIAAVFHLSPTALAQRLVRAKRRVRAARVPFRIPERSELAWRLPPVLEAIYGAYAIVWQTAASREVNSLGGEALYLATTLGAHVALCVAISDVDGAEAALQALERIEGADDFQPAWATRAYLLAQAGQFQSARAAYARTIALTTDAAARARQQRTRDDLG
ncbi:sigma factor [Cryobacterium sp. TMT1-3]|uniref:sigma factor n=1 Tax=Cryobacterium sp. TMT1-3 TaxID=1259237 RepID=UPI001F5431FE|nr:sigma factor [Cryobacterium sp. TMT1-3]